VRAVVIEGIEEVVEAMGDMEHVEVAEAGAVITHTVAVLVVAVGSTNQLLTLGAAGIVGMQGTNGQSVENTYENSGIDQQ